MRKAIPGKKKKIPRQRKMIMKVEHIQEMTVFCLGKMM
jgi:hypothetical protein